MHLSTHYYVLSLGADATSLYEAFRDVLIGVENQGFPVLGQEANAGIPGPDRLRELMNRVDTCFDHYDAHQPLGLVVVGDPEKQSAFDAVTRHGAAVVGRVLGDHTDTHATDLGPIVWPLVKETISGSLERVLRELEDASREGRVVSGLESVASKARTARQATLLVEEDYRVRGSLTGERQSPFISPDVDVRDVIDDAVDAVIEGVLESGGHVVFLRSGSLTERGRIALLLRKSPQS